MNELITNTNIQMNDRKVQFIQNVNIKCLDKKFFWTLKKKESLPEKEKLEGNIEAKYYFVILSKLKRHCS